MSETVENAQDSTVTEAVTIPAKIERKGNIAKASVGKTSKTVGACPICLSVDIIPRWDEKAGYECLECESIFLGDGAGITIANGVVADIANAKSLPDEFGQVTGSITVTGPFRGNAYLPNVPEITLPTLAGVVKAAHKAGLTIQRSEQTLFLTKE